MSEATIIDSLSKSEAIHQLNSLVLWEIKEYLSDVKKEIQILKKTSSLRDM